jgi:tRNA dimethylallyltransferase
MKRLVLIVGPTASGKSDYAIEVAKQYQSPIISCDSRQIYKELKIGTAPPTEEQLRDVRHYFIFSHSIHDYYTAGKYELEALELMYELYKEHDTLVMAGGSGLYADAVCYGIDDFPAADMELREELTARAKEEGGIEALRQELRILDRESYDSIDIANPQRIVRALEVTLSTGKKFSSFKSFRKKEREFEIERIVLSLPREELYDRINKRVDKMMEQGLLKEAESMLSFRNRPALKTVGYKELFDYFDGKTSLDEAVGMIKQNTRRYAKRQITWFRKPYSL